MGSDFFGILSLIIGSVGMIATIIQLIVSQVRTRRRRESTAVKLTMHVHLNVRKPPQRKR